MESTKEKILSWIEISDKVDNGDGLNPIEQLIFDHSPAGDEEDIFRKQVFEAINFEDEETKTNRNTIVVADFIEHCKNEGIEVPDTIFESYFDA